MGWGGQGLVSLAGQAVDGSRHEEGSQNSNRRELEADAATGVNCIAAVTAAAAASRAAHAALSAPAATAAATAAQVSQPSTHHTPHHNTPHNTQHALDVHAHLDVIPNVVLVLVPFQRHITNCTQEAHRRVDAAGVSSSRCQLHGQQTVPVPLCVAED